jgi:hypothetical protein
MYATAKGIDLKRLTNRVGVLGANPTKKALLGKA